MLAEEEEEEEVQEHTGLVRLRNVAGTVTGEKPQQQQQQQRYRCRYRASWIEFNVANTFVCSNLSLPVVLKLLPVVLFFRWYRFFRALFCCCLYVGRLIGRELLTARIADASVLRQGAVPHRQGHARPLQGGELQCKSDWPVCGRLHRFCDGDGNGLGLSGSRFCLVCGVHRARRYVVSVVLMLVPPRVWRPVLGTEPMSACCIPWFCGAMCLLLV